MRLADLASQMGYKLRGFVALIQAKGVTVADMRANVDERMAAAVRAIVPHRSKLAGDLKLLYDRALAPPPRPGARAPVPPPREMHSFADHLKAPEVRLFADTCALMHESSYPVFMGPIKKALEGSGKRLIVPAGVVRELERHTGSKKGSPGDAARRQRLARRGLEILRALPTYQVLDNLKQLDDPIPDEIFQNIFMKHRRDFPMSFITQDVPLMVDILTNSKSNSVRGLRPVAVWEVTPGGLRRVTLEAAAVRLLRQARRRGAPSKN